tara:strand:- start:1904 stop:2512 length:609 start_codon:yes stop_codon:yes gene_type:complete
MAKKKSKSKIAITDKDRKKYGVCEHDQVSYKALDKLNRSLLLHCKRLSRDINRKGRQMELWMKNTQILQDEVKLKNKNLILKEALYLKKLNSLNATYQKEFDELQKLYIEAVDVNKDVVEKNRDCIEKNREITKDHNDIVRAYNGLAEMGKFAEEVGVDIKKHSKRLPEHDKYDFSQSHALLESGKVKHSYKLKKKKNGKEN